MKVLGLPKMLDLPRKRRVVSAAGLALAMLASGLGAPAAPPPQDAAAAPGRHWTADIAEIRRVAGLIPGRRPLRINMLKFAESHRTKDTSVLGAPPEPSVQSKPRDIPQARR